MAAELREIIAVQPMVPIITQGVVRHGVVEALLWGLEEEGIPTITGETTDRSIRRAAKEIAQLSRLNIGIGVSGREQLVVLHHRDLPAEEPLFLEAISSGSTAAFRRIGANAARLVKGNPLLFDEEFEDQPPPPQPQASAEVAIDPQLVARIVQEILTQMATRR